MKSAAAYRGIKFSLHVCNGSWLCKNALLVVMKSGAHGGSASQGPLRRTFEVLRLRVALRHCRRVLKGLMA